MDGLLGSELSCPRQALTSTEREVVVERRQRAIRQEERLNCQRGPPGQHVNAAKVAGSKARVPSGSGDGGVTGLLVAGCAVLGLAVGSFLNVVIYRVPRKQSVVRPRSACPSCGTQIADRDNIPVVSWLALRGRCRHCQAPISVRYPIVESLTAGLFAGAALRFGFDWALPAYLAFLAGLVALACTDLEQLLRVQKADVSIGSGRSVAS